MTTSTPVKDPAELKSLIAARFPGEPDWLTARRQQMADVYFGLPLPERPRTPLKNRKLDRIAVFDEPTAPPGDSPVGLPGQLSGDIFLNVVNGRPGLSAIPRRLGEAGVIIGDLRTAVQNTPELVKPYLGSLAEIGADKFQALNAALWQNGLFLYVPAGVVLAEPITVVHSATRTVTGFLPRSLIVAGPGSSVTVVEHYVSEPADHKVLFAGATEIVALDGSRVHYGSIQNLSPNVDAFLRRVGRVGRDGGLTWSIGEFGAGLAVSGHETHLDQPGGETHSLTVFFGSQTQHQDYTAVSRHIAAHTRSNMVAKGVMKGRARSIFTGVTDIKKGAAGSDGRQKEQTLMLSEEARADAIPSLLIEERDVFAAHAASAGPVDKTALFYLMGRGLPEPQAVRLIVEGFLAPVIDAIPLESVKEMVWEAVERKISE